MIVNKLRGKLIYSICLEKDYVNKWGRVNINIGKGILRSKSW